MAKNKTTKEAEVAAETVEVKATETVKEEVASSTTNEQATEVSKKKKEVLMFQPIEDETPEATVERLRPILWDCMTGYQPKQGYTPWAACRMVCNIVQRFPDTTPTTLVTRLFKNLADEEDANKTMLILTLPSVEVYFKVADGIFNMSFTAAGNGDGEAKTLYEFDNFEEAKQFLRGKTIQEQISEILAVPPTSEGLTKLLELKKSNPDDEKLGKVVNAYTFAFNSLKQLTSITY
jgi:hypothetical protein